MQRRVGAASRFLTPRPGRWGAGLLPSGPCPPPHKGDVVYRPNGSPGRAKVCGEGRGGSEGRGGEEVRGGKEVKGGEGGRAGRGGRKSGEGRKEERGQHEEESRGERDRAGRRGQPGRGDCHQPSVAASLCCPQQPSRVSAAARSATELIASLMSQGRCRWKKIKKKNNNNKERAASFLHGLLFIY